MSEGIKHDQDKVMVELYPTSALWEISKVLTFGAKKYGPHNWRKGMAWSRLYGAGLRHFTKWFEGEDYDPESGLSHLSHLGCNTAFLIDYVANGLGIDDRPKTEKKNG